MVEGLDPGLSQWIVRTDKPRICWIVKQSKQDRGPFRSPFINESSPKTHMHYIPLTVAATSTLTHSAQADELD